jgi:hypothetical protein
MVDLRSTDTFTRFPHQTAIWQYRGDKMRQLPAGVWMDAKRSEYEIAVGDAMRIAKALYFLGIPAIVDGPEADGDKLEKYCDGIKAKFDEPIKPIEPEDECEGMDDDDDRPTRRMSYRDRCHAEVEMSEWDFI